MRPIQNVRIDEITVLSYNWPELRLQVHCGSGTYIRSLGDDIGRALGVGAYVSQLRRTTVGEFDIKDAKSIEHIV